MLNTKHGVFNQEKASVKSLRYLREPSFEDPPGTANTGHSDLLVTEQCAPCHTSHVTRHTLATSTRHTGHNNNKVSRQATLHCGHPGEPQFVMIHKKICFLGLLRFNHISITKIAK